MAAGATYEPIATTTASGGETSITFSSISGTYTDLVLIMAYAQNGGTTRWVTCRLNSDTGNNYSDTSITGNGSSAVSSRNNTYNYIAIHAATDNTTRSNVIVNFQNYSNTTTNKTLLSRGNTAAAGTTAVVGLWRNTAAITSITVGLEFGTGAFASGSTFTLYGITKA